MGVCVYVCVCIRTFNLYEITGLIGQVLYNSISHYIMQKNILARQDIRLFFPR